MRTEAPPAPEVLLALPRPPVRWRPVDWLGLPLAVAVLVALAVLGWDPAAIVPLAAAAAAAPALTRIDLTERRLPNALTVPLVVLGTTGCTWRALTGDFAIAAAVCCTAVLLLMALAGGMGMGDVKLGAGLALATATLGWGAPLAGIAASVIIGGVVGVVAMALGRRSLAFGPWLLLGHALAAGVAALQLG